MSVAQVIATFNAVEDVPDDVNDCWIGGVLYHRCGAGRRFQTKNAVKPCGALKPHSTPHYHRNHLYPKNANGDSYAITCAECHNRNRGQTRPEYRAETPRDKAIVPARVETVAVMGREFTVGWHGDAKYWPVKPFVEAAGLTWHSQHERIARDPDLAKGIRMIRIPSPGGAQATLCLPWNDWHNFWQGVEESLVNEAARPTVRRFKAEAAEALRLVFGDTAGEVLQDKPVAERITEDAAQRVAARPALMPSDAIRQRPDLFLQYADLARAAEAQASRREEVKAATVAARLRAQERKAEAARILAVAEAEEQQAIAAESEAVAADAQARAQLDAILAQIDALADEETQYVYLFGLLDMASRMFADGKVGDTRNKMQRRKQLRQGDLRRDFVAVVPCDDGEECASIILSYLCERGAQKIGNDHFQNAPGAAIARIVGILNGIEYATPDALRARLEVAA